MATIEWSLQRAIHAKLDQMDSPLVQFNKLDVCNNMPLEQLKIPGEAFFNRISKSLIVKCARDTEISVTAVKQEGRNQLPVKEWWNGLQYRGSVIRFK